METFSFSSSFIHTLRKELSSFASYYYTYINKPKYWTRDDSYENNCLDNFLNLVKEDISTGTICDAFEKAYYENYGADTTSDEEDMECATVKVIENIKFNPQGDYEQFFGHAYRRKFRELSESIQQDIKRIIKENIEDEVDVGFELGLEREIKLKLDDINNETILSIGFWDESEHNDFHTHGYVKLYNPYPVGDSIVSIKITSIDYDKDYPWTMNIKVKR